MRICSSCGEENSDRAKFCQNCASPLSTPEEAGGELRKVVTIVFADVTGSTALGERLDPEALRRVMGRYFDEMELVIRAHGGTVEKFIGDAVMAVFGIPRLHEDDPVRAVRAAAGMRASLDRLNEELERDHGVGIAVRIGVNTGEVVAGDPSGGQRLVTGDAVNVAARLEQAASPGEILIGDSTFRLVKDAVTVEPVEPLELKGKAERVPTFRLVEVLADTAGHERRLDSPLVARTKELEMLERALDRARSERTSHLFTLLGPAGVGKSRLVHEFLGAAATEARILRGRCLSYGEGITFYPLAEVVHAAAGIGDADPPAVARERVATLLADADEGERIASLLGGLFGWSEGATTEDATWAVRKFCEHLARERPLVVVFDDIHWAEPTFLDLIEHLADWIRDAAVLLLCIARPELLEIRSGWGGGKMNATSILLEPLPGDAASALIDNLLGRAEMPETARARILEAAEGNPLFVEEMLGMLIDDGLLRFEDGAWRAVEDLAHLTVPPTIQLLLAARLDRLDAEERAVIERGAVEGKIFHTGAVTSLAPDSVRASVPSRLLALARKELIRPDRAEFAGEDAFRFRHLLIRDAAYQAMPKEQRADLHERFATWLERVAGERLAEYEEILAYHLEQAFRFRVELGPADERTQEIGDAAARRLVASAERARERSDFGAARGLFERATEVAPGRAAIFVLLSETLADLREYHRSNEIALEAMAIAERNEDRVSWLRAKLIQSEDLGQIDPGHPIAATLADAGAVLAEAMELGDDATVRQAQFVIARMRYYLGDCRGCSEILATLMIGAASLPFVQRRELVILGNVSAYFGETPADEALASAEERFAMIGGSPVAEALFGTVRAALLAMLGQAELSRAQAARSVELWHELGDPAERVMTHQSLGEAERFLGNPVGAEREFRTAVETLTALGETGFNSTMSALLALALADQGRFDEAEQHGNRGRKLTSEDDFASQVAWRMAKARILASRGRHDEAIRLAAEAVSIVDVTQYLAWHAEALEVMGEVTLAAGHLDDARRAFEGSLERYERKRVIPSAERIRARLATLGS